MQSLRFTLTWRDSAIVTVRFSLLLCVVLKCSFFYDRLFIEFRCFMCGPTC